MARREDLIREVKEVPDQKEKRIEATQLTILILIILYNP